MNSVVADLKYALRLWKKSPGFVAVAVGTLALGISANSVIFSGVESFLLRPLPVPEPERLMYLRERVHKTNAMYAVAYADLLDWRAGAPAFEHIAGIQIDTFNIAGSGEAERVRGSRVMAAFFPAFGLPTVAGRVFSAAEDQQGAAPVVVVSHSLAQRRFGGVEAVGKSMTIDGQPHTIVGVMPPSMRFPMGFADLWVPLAAGPERAARGNHSLAAIARLRPGATFAEAQRQLDAVAHNIAAEYPATNAGMGVWMVPLGEQISSGPKRSIIVLWAAVGFVLLIACANLANLMLARSIYRRREFALRQALGASRWQVSRQLLVESLALSVLGGAGGLLLAAWGLDVLARAVPAPMLPMGGLGINTRVLAFTCILSVLTGMVFGLVPALRSMRATAADALREGGRSLAGGRQSNRLSKALVVGEVTLAVMLLGAAGLLLSALDRMQGVATGFRADHVLTAELALKNAKYSSDAARALVLDSILDRLRATPGITHASAVNFPPMTNTIYRGYSVDGRPPVAEGQRPSMADYHVATADYAAVMSIPVLQGRFLASEDSANSEPVMAVNQRFRDREWPGQNPVGRRIALYAGPGKLGVWRTVVGMVANVRQSGPATNPNAEVYVPLPQAPELQVYIAVRTAGSPAAAIPALEAAVKEVAPDLPLNLVRPMERVMSDALAPVRMTTGLLAILSAIALLLAAMGLYGVISYLVARRTYEFGVRLALGATDGGVLRLVLRGSVGLTAAGTALGLAGAFGLSRVLASLMPGVRPEPGVFLIVTAVLAVVAIASAWWPVRRALACGPLQALRSE